MVLGTSKKFVEQNNILVSKNALNNNLDSKRLVNEEFFSSGTEKRKFFARF